MKLPKRQRTSSAKLRCFFFSFDLQRCVFFLPSQMCIICILADARAGDIYLLQSQSFYLKTFCNLIFEERLSEELQSEQSTECITV